MDHIRSAIDKARKEREIAQQQKNQPEPMTEQKRSLQAQVALEKRWNALPEFGVKHKRLMRNRIMTLQANPAATPFDVMRTNLLHEMRTHNWRRVAITSPGSRCGKTTICLNLAFSLARQRDIRVMVIELDLRRPSITRLLRIRHDTNFADVLSNQVKANDSIQRVGDNLAFAAPQDYTKSSAELLQSVQAAHVIDAIEARYQPDIMIFDMPPMLVADDTMAFIDQVDCTLLVGAAESSTMDEISRCKLDLEQRSNLMGVILNKCRYLDGTDGYGTY